jgi:hypothetical protein
LIILAGYNTAFDLYSGVIKNEEEKMTESIPEEKNMINSNLRHL